MKFTLNNGNLIKQANDGLITKFDTSIIKYKNTFKQAEKLGVDLNNTNYCFKKDGFVWGISFIGYKSKVTGRYTEIINLLPLVRLKK